LLRQDCLVRPEVKDEISQAVEGGAQVLVMSHAANAPMLEVEVKKAAADVQAVMSRLPVFTFVPEFESTSVCTLLDRMYFPDWKPLANKSTTFRKNENPMVMCLFQKCEEEAECQQALQALCNTTSPSSVNASDTSAAFFRDGGLVILKEKLENFGAVAPVCENVCRLVANICQSGGNLKEEIADKVCETGLLKGVVEALNNFTDSGFLQGEACRAICNIAAQSDAAKEKVNELQGFQQVLAAQKRCEYDTHFWDGRFECKRLSPNDSLMVNYGGMGRWISGQVIESYSNGSYDVKYSHGGMGKRVPAHLVRPKDVSDKLLEFCSVWLWKPQGKLTEDELLIKPDGMVSLADSGQVGTWSVVDTEGENRAAIKVQIGTLMLEMERISVTTLRSTNSPHRAVLRDNFRDCLYTSYYNFEEELGDSIPALLGRKPDFTRVEQEINRKVGSGQPWTGLDADFAQNFAASWSGKLSIRKMGQYTFELQADCHARAWINDQLIVNGTKIQLVGGAQSLKVEYYCKSGASKMVTLKYHGPDTNESMNVIPAAVLQHDPHESYAVEKPGFIAEYFPGDFTADKKVPAYTLPDITRTEKTLDFAMGTDAWPGLPSKRYGKSAFGARYTGYVTLKCGGKKKGAFKFFMESGKRGRLSLDDRVIIDETQTECSIELTAGQHLIVVEYFGAASEAHGLSVKFAGPDTLAPQTKAEQDAEKKAKEDYEKAKKEFDAWHADPPEAEEGEDPPVPPPEPVKPADRVPETVAIGPAHVTYFAPDSCCVPKCDPMMKHEKSVSCVAFSQDDGLLVSGGFGGKLCVWNYPTGEYSASIDVGAPILCCDFPKTASLAANVPGSKLNANVVAVGLESGAVVLYDVAKGAEVCELIGHEGPVASVCFNPCRGEEAGQKIEVVERISVKRVASRCPGRASRRRCDDPRKPTL
jgi:hypothetical protein